MERRIRFIVVGIFTLATVVGVFLFIYWLHAAGGVARTRPVRVEFQGSASGLRPGSAVLFNGVRIGEVTSVGFDPGHADRVDVDLALDVSAPVRADARVGVETQGLLGTPVVAIYGVSPAAPLLAASPARVAILRADTSPSMMEQARATLAEIQTVVVDNRAPLKDMIKNADTFAGALGRNADKIDDVLAGLQQFLGHGPKPPPPQFLDLRAASDFAETPPSLTAQIAVADITAPVALHTQKILSRAGPDRPFVLGESQWTDEAPKLIQLKLIESFENAHLAGSVSGPLEQGAPDYQLMIEMRRFEIDLSARQAIVDLSVRLIGKDGRVARARIFDSQAACAFADGAPAAAALGRAFQQVATAIVAWVEANAR